MMLAVIVGLWVTRVAHHKAGRRVRGLVKEPTQSPRKNIRAAILSQELERAVPESSTTLPGSGGSMMRGFARHDTPTALPTSIRRTQATHDKKTNNNYDAAE